MRATYSALTQAERRDAVLAGAQRAPAPDVVQPTSGSERQGPVAPSPPELPAAQLEPTPTVATVAGEAKRLRMRQKGPVLTRGKQEPDQKQQRSQMS